MDYCSSVNDHELLYDAVKSTTKLVYSRFANGIGVNEFDARLRLKLG